MSTSFLDGEARKQLIGSKKTVALENWSHLWPDVAAALAAGPTSIEISTPDDQVITYQQPDTTEQVVEALISDLCLSEEVIAEICSGVPEKHRRPKNPLFVDQVTDPARIPRGPDVLDPGSKGQSL